MDTDHTASYPPCIQLQWGAVKVRGKDVTKGSDEHPRGLRRCVPVCAHVLVCWGPSLERWVTYDAGFGSSSLYAGSPSRLPFPLPPALSVAAPGPASPTPVALVLGLLASLIQPRDSSSFSPPLPWSQGLPSPKPPLGFKPFLSSLRVNLGFWGGMQGTHCHRKRQPSFSFVVNGLSGHI